MFYSKALLHATYINGQPGKRTEAHEKAEYHRFKTEYLFKNQQIPKDLYVACLIQHFLIIKAIEQQLLDIPDENKTEINAFFSLSYLQDLWRTPGIQSDLDLQQLDVHPEDIKDEQIAPATKQYLTEIKQLSPKLLLGHFLLHVAGFMHGGNIIQSKYIEPSNQLTSYQISTAQYDFSAAAQRLGVKSSFRVYAIMMKEMDAIKLTEEEYTEILQQSTSVYATMTHIYDDLCEMYIRQPQAFTDQSQTKANQHGSNYYPLAAAILSMMVIAFVLKMLSEYATPEHSALSQGPR